ncbi:hypothetical protein LTR10_020877 [Elasticomyces elasticus]|uniref:FAD/NAD(P)-binding domain-containing protein n=1 Tax=Exophiala sideris TaxID=1016849 RepID=A0ABR0J1I1_9EURO|nr:hypothetical protein LTR10_020877 [Elasticomyces elasticus]KAK5023410.1 hypothetical protein LTS07_009285 [Exophiala sideris]KAK5028214.1 hypothetical protein LTR13_009202 [Exophiala sideris]KAK5052872.1 hypothetical protein LTR69_009698 [Exophiala sideris]KAK5178483.1 hypothetical protein LTR44_009108 [Eurotiomycetes sp. CCFEE 6388]
MTVPTMSMDELTGDGHDAVLDNVAGYDVNEQFIRKAVNDAEANIMRMALYQTTRDPELAQMKVERKPIRGGVLFDYVLTPEDEKLIRDKTIAYLLQGPRSAPPPPDREEAYEMMDMFSDKPMREKPGEPSFDYDEAYEELAIEDYPRAVRWSGEAPSKPKLEKWKVLVVGAGISGIAAAIPLKHLGISFDVVERQNGVGGTWLLNSYPGARVDTMSFLFQYKFEKNYPWTEYFACAGETCKYLQYVSTKYGVAEHITFNTEVTGAVWDEDARCYDVSMQDKNGNVQHKRYNAIISAAGLFSTPNALPDIKGIKDFQGPIFHTAKWAHEVDIKGKRVAQIGTGSTGAQLAPCLAEEVDTLAIYQRTPNWMFKIEGYRNSVTHAMRWLCDHMPSYWNWFCWVTYYRSLHLASIQLRDGECTKNSGGPNKRNDALKESLTNYYKSVIGDRPELLEQMLPSYAPLVRRLVVDNGFLETLKRDNVELVTQGINCINKTGILTKDGKQRDFDVIVLGAGFKVSQYLWPVNYVGRDGMTLAKAWKRDGARSYLGMTMPHYPNLFTAYGPNHQPRGGSLFSYGEVWARYAVASIAGMIERDVSAMEVKQDVFDRYQDKLDAQNSKLIWESAGSSYYVNEHGRQGVNMPWTTAEYHPMIAKPNFDDFVLAYASEHAVSNGVPKFTHLSEHSEANQVPLRKQGIEDASVTVSVSRGLA